MRKFVTVTTIALAAATLAACETKTETTTTTNTVVMNEDVVLNDETPVMMNDGNMADGNIAE
jgi:uncharacterized protein YcfL